MKNVLILLFLIFSQNNFSQNNHINRLYEVTFGGKPQTVKLIEYKNGTVEGFLQTELIEERLNKKDKEIIKKTTFNDDQTKKMLTDLKNAGFETLKKCEEDPECEKLGFLDGNHTTFKILTSEINREISFSEIHPQSQTKGNLEEIELRKQAQLLATIIDKEINLEKQFSSIIKSLKKGTYCYWDGAILKVCIKHK